MEIAELLEQLRKLVITLDKMGVRVRVRHVSWRHEVDIVLSNIHIIDDRFVRCEDRDECKDKDEVIT